MKALILSISNLVNLKYKLDTVTFIDQFWNKIIWKQCSCWKVWLERDYLYYNNYWWPVKKWYIYNDCFELLKQVTDRIARNRKYIHSSELTYKRWLWGMEFKK